MNNTITPEEISKWMKDKAAEAEGMKATGAIVIIRAPKGGFSVQNIGMTETGCAAAAGVLAHQAAVNEMWERMLMHEAATAQKGEQP